LSYVLLTDEPSRRVENQQIEAAYIEQFLHKCMHSEHKYERLEPTEYSTNSLVIDGNQLMSTVAGAVEEQEQVQPQIHTNIRYGPY
jgi:hypothetical protein